MTTMLEKMKNKTYRNFMVVKNLLTKEKGYDATTSTQIAHRIFDNYELDNTRTIKDYYDRVISREEFEAQF
jgi:hypothetical protein